MRRLHVCHVIEATMAGVRRHVVDLARHLPTDRVQQTIICSFERADEAFRAFASADHPGVSIIEVPMRSTISPGHDVLSIARLAGALSRARPDVIHVHSGKAGLLGRLAAWLVLPRTPIVYTPNSSPFRESRAHRLVEMLLCSATDLVIAVSASEYAELRDNGIVREERLTTVWNGIDAEESRQITRPRSTVRRELGVPDDAILVGAVGRLAPQKAPEAFVETAARVRQADPRAYFLWVGDGELRARVDAAVARLDLTTCFSVTGYTVDVRPYLNAMDICCMLSEYEGMPYVALEAMAVGLPLVGTRVPGIIDAVTDGKTGFLIPPGDTEAAANRLLQLCGSPDMRRAQAATAKRRVEERFSVRRMAADTFAAYQRLSLLSKPAPQLATE